MDFEEKLSRVYKLKEGDRKKILNKVFIYKANDSFQKESYEECAKLLEKAKKNGYNIKDFPKYNELLTKLNTEDKNSLKTILQVNILIKLKSYNRRKLCK